LTVSRKYSIGLHEFACMGMSMKDRILRGPASQTHQAHQGRPRSSWHE
jgi:hypothetical protein